MLALHVEWDWDPCSVDIDSFGLQLTVRRIPHKEKQIVGDDTPG